MTCEICHEGPLTDGRTIHRVNPIGEMPPVWRCEVHLTHEQLDNLDPGVMGIVDIIEADNLANDLGLGED